MVPARLVSGAGNFGGRDYNVPPSADRYTESRPSHAGQGCLRNHRS